MTTKFLAGDLAQDEGLRLEAYPDPLSGGEPWTIGHGHTGPGIYPGLKWTPMQAAVALNGDIATAEAILDTRAPWWRTLSDERQDVLANMCFNLGWPRLSGFHHALAAIQRGDFEAAAAHMLDSAWARQVGHRAIRLAEQMRTGKRA